MRAFVITGPGECEVRDVAPPAAGPGQVVVDIERAGVCGTDVEFFTGQMSYLHQGHAQLPMRIGHEWCGTVSAVGDGVDPAWLGRRTTGDTMLGCGRCQRCLTGRQHVCEDRFEIGVRRGWPGALAEQMPVPVTALHPLPDSVDMTAGALVEPGGNALRSVEASCLAPGDRVLVLGPGGDRTARRAVRAVGGRGGTPHGPLRAVAGVRPHTRGTRHVDGRAVAWAGFRCGDRLLERGSATWTKDL